VKYIDKFGRKSLSYAFCPKPQPLLPVTRLHDGAPQLSLSAIPNARVVCGSRFVELQLLPSYGRSTSRWRLAYTTRLPLRVAWRYCSLCGSLKLYGQPATARRWDQQGVDALRAATILADAFVAK